MTFYDFRESLSDKKSKNNNCNQILALAGRDGFCGDKSQNWIVFFLICEAHQNNDDFETRFGEGVHHNDNTDWINKIIGGLSSQLEAKSPPPHFRIRFLIGCIRAMYHHRCGPTLLLVVDTTF